MQFYERIRMRREELGMTQEELATKVGYKSRSTINKIEMGLRGLSYSKIVAFSNALHTTPVHLMGWDATQETDTDSIYAIKNIIELPSTHSIPLMGTIACGTPTLAEGNFECYVSVDTKINADFALKCKDDGMINARIFKGDIVYIRQQSDVSDGEIAAVLIGNEATLKKVHKFKNKLVLSPANPMYDDIVYTDEQLNDIRILGKAVAFISLIR